MKKVDHLLPLVQDNNIRIILQEILAELNRINAIPAVTLADTTKVRDAINRIIGKV